MSMTPQELTEAIHNAFATAHMPQELVSPSDRIHYLYETEHLQKSFSGKTWQQISPATLKDCGSMLMYFTPAAFCYYLPACLILTLDYYNSDYVGDSTLHLFSVDGYAERLRNVLELLTDQQKQVIWQIFDYLHHSVGEDDPIPTPSPLLRISSQSR